MRILLAARCMFVMRREWLTGKDECGGDTDEAEEGSGLSAVETLVGSLKQEREHRG